MVHRSFGDSQMMVKVYSHTLIPQKPLFYRQQNKLKSAEQNEDFIETLFLTNKSSPKQLLSIEQSIPNIKIQPSL